MLAGQGPEALAASLLPVHEPLVVEDAIGNGSSEGSTPLGRIDGRGVLGVGHVAALDKHPRHLEEGEFLEPSPADATVIEVGATQDGSVDEVGQENVLAVKAIAWLPSSAVIAGVVGGTGAGRGEAIGLGAGDAAGAGAVEGIEVEADVEVGLGAGGLGGAIVEGNERVGGPDHDDAEARALEVALQLGREEQGVDLLLASSLGVAGILAPVARVDGDGSDGRGRGASGWGEEGIERLVDVPGGNQESVGASSHGFREPVFDAIERNGLAVGLEPDLDRAVGEQQLALAEGG